MRRYAGQHQRRHVETFIPLTRDPGQRLEADFGHIYVDFPQGRRQIPVLLLVWSHSNCPFAMALPSERTEAILEGTVQGLTFFDCVPREVWWDYVSGNIMHIVLSARPTRVMRANPRETGLADKTC